MLEPITMKTLQQREGLMNTFRMITYGIMVASFVLVSSGCYEWNRRGDYSGYDRVGSSYDRNDRRWDGDRYRGGGYSRPDRRDSDWERN
jgi:hypothetical protein